MLCEVKMGFLGVVARPFRVLGRGIKQILAELSKVVTPTVKSWLGWCIAVFVFVSLLMVLVGLGDMGLGRLTLWVFGG